MAEIAINLKGQDNLSSTVKGATKSVEDLKKATTEVGKCSKEFDRIKNAGLPLKRELRQLKELMAQMDFKDLRGGPEFAAIARHAGEVAKAIDAGSEATKAFNSDVVTLDAMTTAMQGVTGAFTAGTAAMNLFGVENEDVANAILKVQSAMALLNGVTAVANALNKDSVLMLKLKQIQLRLNTSSSVTNTTVETAGTAALAANTTATGANATSKGLLTRMLHSATLAQIKNNLAVLANPYVAAAAAIAALVAGIVSWISSSSEATEKQQALKVATEALNEELENQMGDAVKQIEAFKELKKEYEQSGDKADDFAKSLINNEKWTKKLGIKITTLADAQDLLNISTADFIEYTMDRARAMAAEAAATSLLTKTYVALSKIRAKAESGEEVDWADVIEVFTDELGMTEKNANKLLKSSGFREAETFGYNDFVDSGDWDELYSDLLKQTSAYTVLEELAKNLKEKVIKSDTGKKIQELQDKLLKDNEETGGTTTHSTTTHSKIKEEDLKNVGDLIKKVDTMTNSAEDNEKAIEMVSKAIKGLDTESKTYAEDLANLLIKYKELNKNQLKFGDKSTIEGLKKYQTKLKQYLTICGRDTQEYTDILNEIYDVTQNIGEQEFSLIETDTLDGLRNAQSYAQSMLNISRLNSKEYSYWSDTLKEINKQLQIVSFNINNDDAFNAFNTNTIETYQKQIDALNKELNTFELSPEVRFEKTQLRDSIQRKMDETTKGKLSIPATVTPSYTKTGSVEDMEQSYSNAEEAINRILSRYEKGIGYTRKEAENAIAEVNDKLIALGMKPIKVHLKTNSEEVIEGIQNIFNVGNPLVSTLDAVDSLTEAVAEGASAWEIFKSAISATEQALSSLQSVLTFVQTLKTLNNATSAATGALTQTSTAASATTGALTQTNTATGVLAETTGALADNAAKIAANKMLAESYMELAAAKIFAAHSYIPFVGVGIATGQVAAMTAAMTTQKALWSSMFSFAEGGIVGGGSHYGDKLLVRVNSGEMILNGTQQRRLFNLLDGSGATKTTSMGIEWRLRGADIYGSLKNYSKIKGKTSNTII